MVYLYCQHSPEVIIMLLKFPPFRIDHFKLLILHFALFTFLSAGAPDTLWTRIYGGDDGEEGSSVQQTADGGFIIAGTTHSFGADSDDVYLIQTDSNGDTLWTRTYGGYYKDWGNSVKQTNDSGFIITGMTQNIDSVYGDVFLIRTDSNGDTLWTKTYGGEDSDQGHSVQQTSDGGFIIVGNTWHLGTDAYNVYLVRTNLSGDTLWTRSYGGNDDDFGYSVQQTTDSGFIIVGSTSSFGAGGRDVYLIKINSKGDSLWTKTYGDTENDQGYSVMQTIDGGFIITGSTSSFSARITNVYLIKTDSNGDTLWTKIYRSNYMGEGCSVQQLSDGGFIIAGVSESFGLGSYGVYIIRTNSEGDTIWTNTYGRSLFNSANK